MHEVLSEYTMIPVQSKQFSDEAAFCYPASLAAEARCFCKSFPNPRCKTSTTFNAFSNFEPYQVLQVHQI
jgi:hypothetical protein